MTGDLHHADNCATAAASTTTLVFTLAAGIDALARVASLLQEHGVGVQHLETRPSRRQAGHIDFLLVAARPQTEMAPAIDDLREATVNLKVLSVSDSATSPHRLSIGAESSTTSTTAWFPRHISDLDTAVDSVVDLDAEFSAIPPGWDDPAYRARRQEIVALTKAYRHGRPLPHVDYRPEEVATWRHVFETQTKLFPSHACREYNAALAALRAGHVYSAERIPQLQEVSDFLERRTGFRLRPVAGLLSPRLFLNSLAFRVFHATQYVRHHEHGEYTPEPDVCHDLLGHAPLFADPEFAQFSQDLGMASLGAGDEEIKKLSNLYWYTMEYGMSEEDGQRKAYGAGLLAGMSELPRSIGSDVKTLPLNMEVAAVEKYVFDGFQHLYFVAKSFKEATAKLRDFAKKIPHSRVLRYNPLTSSIEVLDDQESVARVMDEAVSDMELAREALTKLKVH